MEIKSKNLGFIGSFLQDDIQKAIKLRERFEYYLKDFVDINDSESIKIAKGFTQEFEEYEKNNVSLLPMNFLYGNMSKAYLHSKELDNADSYAVAYLKLNEKAKDREGIEASLISIIDVQIVKGSFEIAYYFCEEYLKRDPDSESYREVKNMLNTLLISQNIVLDIKEFEKKSNQFLENVKMPKLYSTLINEEKLIKESALRGISITMGISKESAKKYWDYAQENKDKYFSDYKDLIEAFDNN